MSRPPLLDVQGLKMHFPVNGGLLYRQIATVHAVDGVDLQVGEKETLGLVGESGCGKSTTGRAILRLYKPTAGKIIFNGQDISTMKEAELRPVREHIQMVFQDPMDSLNSRQTVAEILEEPLIIFKKGDKASRQKKIRSLLDTCGMPLSALSRYPHEFSGGQRQRVGIARALALNPKLVVCDEPVSALDVSIQAQILNLLVDLQNEFRISFLFIAHDLSVVRHISDRVAVMYLGQVVEIANADTLYKKPRHPYTKALIASVPEIEAWKRSARKKPLAGEVPSPMNPPPGCRFSTRCPLVTDKCRQVQPTLAPKEQGDADHLVACHHAD